MGLSDLVKRRGACAAPGSSSSSSNPLSSFADVFIGHSPKSELSKGLSASAVCLKAVPLPTGPGNEDEVLDQESVRSMKGTNLVNGHHGDACSENSQTSILYGPGLIGIKSHLRESEEIDSATSMTFKPKFDGPPEMDVPDLLLPSPFQSYEVLAHQHGEHLEGLVKRSVGTIDASYDIIMNRPRRIPHPQMDEFWNQPPTTLYELQNRSTEIFPHPFEQQHGANSWISQFEEAQLAKGQHQIGGIGITNMVGVEQSHTLEQMSARDDHPKFQGIDRRAVSDDELSGDWLSLLWIALSHLGGLSQPRFFDELIKWHEQVIGHRVWIEMEGLQHRSGWSVKVEATRGSLFDALQDAAMLVVITMRQHFPVEFRGTPFMVLPMAPGQRTRLDYPVTDGNAVATTFMGITHDDVATLQRERFTSFQSEFSESLEALEEQLLRRAMCLAVARMLMEELPWTPERSLTIVEILENSGNKEADFIPRDCGWSVRVSVKAQS